ncbi:hypothetical protein FKM82_009571 [Ascaphus truei]
MGVPHSPTPQGLEGYRCPHVGSPLLQHVERALWRSLLLSPAALTCRARLLPVLPCQRANRRDFPRSRTSQAPCARTSRPPDQPQASSPHSGCRLGLRDPWRAAPVSSSALKVFLFIPPIFRELLRCRDLASGGP